MRTGPKESSTSFNIKSVLVPMGYTISYRAITVLRTEVICETPWLLVEVQGLNSNDRPLIRHTSSGSHHRCSTPCYRPLYPPTIRRAVADARCRHTPNNLIHATGL
ncbi:hypothetical protein MLPF_2853 [Mycobacterium lepromatosis]|nr:hypothetical protein MLPF_2853 [Mycobacterium lepromatosis]